MFTINPLSLPTTGTTGHVDAFNVIKITGEERCKYLQGQVTCNVESLAENAWVLGAHCDFKGKMWSIFYLIKTADALYLVTTADCADTSLQELKKYGVFSKVDIAMAPEWAVGLRISDPSAALDANAVHVDTKEMALSLTPMTQLVLTATAFADDFSALFNALQINMGVAQLGAATIGEFVPQMVNLQALQGAIDFSKGCYMGQEVVARTKYLGKNKRAGFILHSQQSIAMQQGDVLEYAIGENWRRAGTVLNHAQYADESWCIAVLPNDLDSQTVLRLKAQPEVTLSIVPTPYTLTE